MPPGNSDSISTLVVLSDVTPLAILSNCAVVCAFNTIKPDNRAAQRSDALFINVIYKKRRGLHLSQWMSMA
jgi:hypothetical protein